MSPSKQTLPRLAALFWIVFALYPLDAKQYSFRKYGPPEGLKNQSVNCLLEDRNGFIWVGTENGLFRYEGEKFRRFDTTDGLPDNTIQSLYESSDGRIWVGTRIGLASLQGEGFVADHELGKVALFGFSNISGDKSGSIYVATSLGLAVASKPKSGFPYHFRLLSHEAVYALALDSGGDLFFSARDRLWKFHHGTFQSLSDTLHLPDDQWTSILPDREGNLWIRSSRALAVNKKGSDHFEFKAHVPHSADLSTLYQSQEGQVFVPTEFGLYLFSGDGFERVSTAEGLPINAAGCVLQDHEGSVWVGMRGTGLVRWLGFDSWEGWKASDGLTSDVIWGVTRDHAGTLWVATNDGLNAWNAETQRFQSWPAKVNTRGLNVRTLLDDPAHDALWFGAKPGGLYRLDHKNSRLTRFGAPSGLASEYVNNLAWDTNHHLWVSTEAGLYCGTLDGERLTFVRPDLPFSYANEAFNGATVDHKGRFWVAGSNGLLIQEAGGWRRISALEGLAASGVSQVTETPDGAIWVAYLSNSGVSRLTEHEGKLDIQNVTTANGLSSNGSVFLGLDFRHWLWVGSDNGLDVLTPAGWRHHDATDGLIWDDVDAVAFYAEPDGSVWIGTSLGLSRFHLPKLMHPQFAPQTTVLSVRAGRSEYDPLHSFSVDYLNRSVAFTFATSTHLDEEAIRYRYRLVGLDRVWNETSEQTAKYSSLPPGRYTFEVLSRSAAGLWSRTPTQVCFSVLPPWWGLWYVRTAFFALGIGVAVLIWRVRIRMLMRRQAHLEGLLCQAERADRLKSEALERLVKAEALQRRRSKVLELVGACAPLENILEALLDVIEVDQPNTICSIFRVSGERLHLAASRRLPARLKEWLERNPASLDRSHLSGAGQRRSVTEPVDISQQLGSPDAASLAEELSLFSARSSPILSSAETILGVLTVYRTSLEDQPSDLALIDEAVRLAGIAMENQDLYRQLSYRAQFDGLTDLPNRALFQDRLQQAVSRAERSGKKFAVAWLDLDGFKHVNDTLGHQAGDILLQKTAARLSKCLRGSDTLARVGGDEFTIIVSDVDDVNQIESVMKKVLATFETPIVLDGRPISVSASVGVSVFPDDSRDPLEIVKQSDIAMYHAKRIGKDAFVFFSSELSHLESDRVQLESHLRQALVRQEFELHYQAQFNQRGEIECVEALLRWNSPELGSIPPAQFIPVAEATGLIIPLGLWALSHACEQTVRWREAGFPERRIAVNVSAAQFARADFAESVASILRKTGLPPRNLELELTETAIIRNLVKSSSHLRDIQNLGVRVAIDDFGTGYSSLSYLQHLPVHTLKLDRSFVQNLDRERASRVIVQAIVKLAHELGLEVVAEGVETEEQLCGVWAAGCDLAQGYLLSRPVSSENATALLRVQKTLRLASQPDLATVA